MTYPPGFSKGPSWALLVFFFFSLIFHGVVLLVVPNFLAVKRIEIIPFTYMKPLEVRIRKLPPLPSKTKAVSKKSRKPAENRKSSRFIKEKLQTISLGKGLFLPPPSIQLPTSEIVNDQERIKELYSSKQKNRERLGSSALPMGVPNLLPNMPYESPALSSPKGEMDYTEGLVMELKKEIQTKEKNQARTGTIGKEKRKRISNIRLGVEGPVSERGILYRPPLPKISTEQTVQIKLKFWVAPNGIVDQIIPVERGGTKLEAVAIDFLKRWKFEPLPSGVKQERQWGILTVKFVVK